MNRLSATIQSRRKRFITKSLPQFLAATELHYKKNLYITSVRDAFLYLLKTQKNRTGFNPECPEKAYDTFKKYKRKYFPQKILTTEDYLI